MELFGLLLALPFTAIASAVYVWGVVRFVVPTGRVAAVLRALSWLPSLATLSELVLVSIVGVVEARTVLGPGFMALHSAFLFTPPALVNLILLYRRPPSSDRVVVTAVACWAASFGLILFNIVVSEALFGIDGSGGPFGRP